MNAIDQSNGAPLTRRHQWCGILGALCYPQNPTQATTALAKFLPMLSDLPAEAFTTASAEHVASQPRRMAMPSYDELGKALRLWWRDNRPQQRRIGQDKAQGWDERDDVWMAYWHRRRAEGFAPSPGLSRPPGGMSWRDHCASLVRTYSPRAWGKIVEEGAHR